jgi:hypothetical protein
MFGVPDFIGRGAWSVVPNTAMATTDRFLLLLGCSRQFGANASVEWKKVSCPLCPWSYNATANIAPVCFIGSVGLVTPV